MAQIDLEIDVDGGEEFARLGKRLRKAGLRGLRKELTDGIRAAARPVADATKREALALPAPSGAIRKRVAKSVKLRVRTAGQDVGVRIVSVDTPLRPGPKAKPMAIHLNRGAWRHPTFGHRDRWVLQTVPPGWFDRPTKRAAPKARAEIQDAMHRVAREIEG